MSQRKHVIAFTIPSQQLVYDRGDLSTEKIEGRGVGLAWVESAFCHFHLSVSFGVWRVSLCVIHLFHKHTWSFKGGWYSSTYAYDHE